MTTKIVSDATFQADVTDAAGPVLVDFWAQWCGPCRVISPALEEIAAELGERLTLAKIDVDENPAAAARFGVRSIPTLMLFRDGKPFSTRIGAAPKGELRAWIVGEI